MKLRVCEPNGSINILIQLNKAEQREFVIGLPNIPIEVVQRVAVTGLELRGLDGHSQF